MANPTGDRPRRRSPLAARIVLAMVLGMGAGVVLGERAEPLRQLGSLIIDMIKGLAGPLLLFAVIDAFLRTEVRARSGAVLVAIALVNAVIALAIGLVLSNALQPGLTLHISDQAGAATAGADFARAARGVDPSRKIEFVDELVAMIPTSLVKPIVDNAVISIVIVAVLLGAALRRAKTEQIARGETAYLAVERGVVTTFRAIEIILSWAILLVPLAVFGVVARTVGHYGFRPFAGLLVYLGVGMLGLGIQVAVVYQLWIKFVARMPLRRFWAGAQDAVVYAMGTASSLATLPVTLRSLDRMGVSPQSARMAACVGTNLNNDGILLYEAMAVLFVAQASGVHLSLAEQLTAAGACAIAGIGISGVPEAGLISLIIVVRTVHLPETIVPLLLTVDWVLGRCRAMTNVVSDITVAVLLDRLAPPSPTEPVACEPIPAGEAVPINA
ncbi:MAG TPA: dicarboxylate/amino acid:cation symporter [Isosphaeraceae bacterium]